MKKLFLIILSALLAASLLAACSPSVPEAETSVWNIGGIDYTVGASSDIRAEYSGDAGLLSISSRSPKKLSLDLSALSSCEGLGSIDISLPGGVESITLPEIDDLAVTFNGGSFESVAYTGSYLKLYMYDAPADFTALAGLNGRIAELYLTVYQNLAPAAELGLDYLSLSEAAFDLSPAGLLDNLNGLGIFNCAETDLSPVASSRIELLRLQGVTAEQVSAISGAPSLATLQINDDEAGDFAVLGSLPALKELILLIGPLQPQDVVSSYGRTLTAEDISVIRQISGSENYIDSLAAFVQAGGAVMLLPESNRT